MNSLRGYGMEQVSIIMLCQTVDRVSLGYLLTHDLIQPLDVKTSETAGGC